MNQLIQHHAYAQEWPLTYPITATAAEWRTSPRIPASADLSRQIIRRRTLGRRGGQTDQRRFTPSGEEFNSSLPPLPTLHEVVCTPPRRLRAEPGS
jgi:hypothetical protein